MDVGYFSQTLIDNYKVGTVIKGADIEVGEDDPVFAFASLLPLPLFEDKTKLTSFSSSLLKNCERDAEGDLRKTLESPDTAFLFNAKFSNLPLQITAQLYKALKMELITERKENPVYNIRNVLVFGKSYIAPEERKSKRTKRSAPQVEYQNRELTCLSEVASQVVSWKVPDETLAEITNLPAEDELQGYRSAMLVPIDKFLKTVDKIVDILTEEG